MVIKKTIIAEIDRLHQKARVGIIGDEFTELSFEDWKSIYPVYGYKKRIELLYQDTLHNGYKREEIKTVGRTYNSEKLYNTASSLWKKDQYEKMYNEIEAGFRVVAYVDSDLYCNGSKIIDIATISRDQWSFGAIGNNYSNFFSIQPSLEEFIQECERLNIEWLDESAFRE